MEDMEHFLKTSEKNSNYICIVSVHYVPLMLDAVRDVKFYIIIVILIYRMF